MADEEKSKDELLVELRSLRAKLAGLEDSDGSDGLLAQTSAVNKSGVFYQSIIEDLPELISRFLPDGTLTFVNNAYCHFYGETREELIGRTFRHHLPEEEREDLLSFLASFSPQHPVSTIEHWGLDSSGTVRWLQWTDRAFFDAQGQIAEFQAVGRDITERRQIEEKLRESESKYRAIFEDAPLGIFRSTPEGRFIEVNTALAQLLGYESPEAVVREIYSIADQIYVRREDRHRIVEQQLRSCGMMQHYNRYRRRDGTEFVASLYLHTIRDPAGQPLYFEGIVEDITERRKSEEALRESESRYRRIVDTANEGIWEMDSNYLTVYVNQIMAQMLGYDPSEMLGRPVTCFMFQEDLQDHQKQMSERVEGRDGTYERRFRKKNGGEVWTRVHATALGDDQGRFLGSFAMFTDITGRKQAEEMLRRSEERYRMLAEQSLQGIALFRGIPPVFAYVNPKWSEIFGYTPDEVMSLNAERIWGLVHPDDREWVRQRHRDRLMGKSVPPRYEFRIIRKDGTLRWVEVFAGMMESEDEPMSQAVYVDITERKLTEDAIRAREHYLQTILQTSADGFMVLDSDGVLIEVNGAYCAMSGFAREEILGKSINELDAVEVPSETAARIQRVMGNGSQLFETIHRRKDGSAYPVEVSATWLNEDGGRFICFYRDLTERRQREERIALLARMLDAAPASITIHDTEGRFLFANRTTFALHGYDLEEDFVAINLHDLHVPESEAMLEERFRRIKEEGEARFEVAHYRKDGSAFPLEVLAKSIEWNGQPAILSIASDITERKQAEEALMVSEKKFRSYVESSPVGIFISDDQGVLVEVNQSACIVTGYSREELLRMHILDLYTAEHRQTALDHFKSVHEKGRISIELPFVRKDGDQRHWTIDATRLPENQVMGFTTDITERKQAEEEKAQLEARLRQAQKLEAIGTLAGGIAHDFNNILAPIIGYTEMVISDAPPSSTMRDDLEQVLKAAHRAKDLVKQILAFSRHTEGEQRIHTDIGTVVKEALRLLRASIPATIEIKQDIRKGMALADPTQIHQVLVNLCTNASHALDGKGVIDVSLQGVDLREQDLRSPSLSSLTPGKYLKLRVSDTGCGMTPEIMQRIFDPYFTTKEVGKGSGLGLAVIHGIVKRHEGGIFVQSESGKGSTFDIYIPSIEEKSEGSVRTSQILPGGTERILLIDDEQMVIDLSERMLKRLGYKVTTVDNALDALEAFRAGPDRFDLIITDYSMPYMTGTELAGEILKIRSTVPIILCTGYSEKVTESTAKELGIAGFAMKPLDRRQLAELVRSALDEGLS